jgi:hypothetical protein
VRGVGALADRNFDALSHPICFVCMKAPVAVLTSLSGGPSGPKGDGIEKPSTDWTEV